MSRSKVLVTGASGHLGKRVVELLLEQGDRPIVATTRTPQTLGALGARGVDVRRASFDDPERDLAHAFEGAERLLLVSTDRVEHGAQRAAQHLRALRAAERAGVRHVVYTSLPNPYASSIFLAEDHARTEDALSQSGLEYTILRNNLYADNLLRILPAALARGQLIDAKGEGAIAWVTREDCARAAAAALSSNDGGRRRLDVTGPEPISSARLAQLASRVTGKPLVHRSVPSAALVRGFIEHGLSELEAEVYASFDVAAARGDFANVSDTVARLTGRAPESVERFLEDNRAALG